MQATARINAPPQISYPKSHSLRPPPPSIQVDSQPSDKINFFKKKSSFYGESDGLNFLQICHENGFLCKPAATNSLPPLPDITPASRLNFLNTEFHYLVNDQTVILSYQDILCNFGAALQASGYHHFPSVQIIGDSFIKVVGEDWVKQALQLPEEIPLRPLGRDPLKTSIHLMRSDRIPRMNIDILRQMANYYLENFTKFLIILQNKEVLYCQGLPALFQGYSSILASGEQQLARPNIEKIILLQDKQLPARSFFPISNWYALLQEIYQSYTTPFLIPRIKQGLISEISTWRDGSIILQSTLSQKFEFELKIDEPFFPSQGISLYLDFPALNSPFPESCLAVKGSQLDLIDQLGKIIRENRPFVEEVEGYWDLISRGYVGEFEVNETGEIVPEKLKKLVPSPYGNSDLLFASFFNWSLALQENLLPESLTPPVNKFFVTIYQSLFQNSFETIAAALELLAFQQLAQPTAIRKAEEPVIILVRHNGQCALQVTAAEYSLLFPCNPVRAIKNLLKFDGIENDELLAVSHLFPCSLFEKLPIDSPLYCYNKDLAIDYQTLLLLLLEGLNRNKCPIRPLFIQLFRQATELFLHANEPPSPAESSRFPLLYPALFTANPLGKELHEALMYASGRSSHPSHLNFAIDLWSQLSQNKKKAVSNSFILELSKNSPHLAMKLLKESIVNKLFEQAKIEDRISDITNKLSDKFPSLIYQLRDLIVNCKNIYLENRIILHFAKNRSFTCVSILIQNKENFKQVEELLRLLAWPQAYKEQFTAAQIALYNFWIAAETEQKSEFYLHLFLALVKELPEQDRERCIGLWLEVCPPNKISSTLELLKLLNPTKILLELAILQKRKTPETREEWQTFFSLEKIKFETLVQLSLKANDLPNYTEESLTIFEYWLKKDDSSICELLEVAFKNFETRASNSPIEEKLLAVVEKCLNTPEEKENFLTIIELLINSKRIKWQTLAATTCLQRPVRWTKGDEAVGREMAIFIRQKKPSQFSTFIKQARSILSEEFLIEQSNLFLEQCDSDVEAINLINQRWPLSLANSKKWLGIAIDQFFHTLFEPSAQTNDIKTFCQNLIDLHSTHFSTQFDPPIAVKINILREMPTLPVDLSESTLLANFFQHVLHTFGWGIAIHVIKLKTDKKLDLKEQEDYLNKLQQRREGVTLNLQGFKKAKIAIKERHSLSRTRFVTAMYLENNQPVSTLRKDQKTDLEKSYDWQVANLIIDKCYTFRPEEAWVQMLLIALYSELLYILLLDFPEKELECAHLLRRFINWRNDLMNKSYSKFHVLDCIALKTYFKNLYRTRNSQPNSMRCKTKYPFLFQRKKNIKKH